MMSRILNNHPSVFTFRELHFFEQICAGEELEKPISEERAMQMLKRLLGIQAEDYWTYDPNNANLYEAEAQQILQGISAPIMAYQVFDAYLAHIAIKNNAQYACDQTPRNIFYIDQILRLFPHAKCIMMVRDPRAVLLSQKNKWRRKFLGADNMPMKEVVRNFINYHPFTIGMLWKGAAKQTLMNKDRERVMMVRFEDFIGQSNSIVAQICDFVGLNYDPKMLQVPHKGSSNASDNSDELGIRKTVSDAWRNSNYTDGEIYCMQLVVKKEMEALGYELMKFKFPPISALLYIMYFPIHVVLILFANFGRAKNLGSAIMKRLKSI
jgi:hypothetical protein